MRTRVFKYYNETLDRNMYCVEKWDTPVGKDMPRWMFVQEAPELEWMIKTARRVAAGGEEKEILFDSGEEVTVH